MKKRILIALLCSTVALPAWADVTYEQEMKASGMMKMFMRGQKTTTSISGDKMLTENKNDIQIVDVEAEKIYQLDTKKKTYSVTTFEEMKKRLDESMAKLQQKESEGGQDISAKADIKVTETGNSETIEGQSCLQYLMQTDLEIEDQSKGEDATMLTLTELWLTKDAPGTAEINAFYRKMAKKLGTTAIGRQIMSEEGQGNQFAGGMQQMADEMRKLDGFAMRSVFYFGDAEAARKEAMGGGADKEEKGGGGLGGFMKKIPGAGGGGDGGILIKMTTEVKKIETNPIKPEKFAVPSNYKQVEPDWK